MKWNRVTRAEPCPICQHTDWCTWSEIGHCCMRVESGRPMANGGWLHRGDEKQVEKRAVTFTPEPPPEPLNVDSWLNKCACLQSRMLLARFANEIGVSIASLDNLNCRRAPQGGTWAFPMRNGAGQMVGIRLRHEDGQKWAVKGSKQGLFIPQCESQEMALICEGPTDTAAALTMGFFAIGRPSCMGGNQDLNIAIKRLRVRRVAMIVDNDEPGIRGAQRLQQELGISSAIVLLPCKDIREFLVLGGTRNALNSIISTLVWTRKK